ncbi:aromatic ring-hydroxylating oxygenase subunit alpha [Pusillimonas noertemannii]|uniref:aromatic ring-hydroxylating oxygenase subunit alpha n=1 Tax=Pusillimonas noertemannii TaxID=305977 RepID=UPI0002D39C31|nr:Rieske 2Fe-2S domain-containing protein [Pusillimonas noertemannii]
MNYRHDRAALDGLVQAGQVHRDAYLSEEIFELERERLFSRSWLYVGHESQVPGPGDYITVDLAGSSVVMVRDTDGSVRVLINRCAHKGARLVSEPQGNAGRVMRCPYHAWTYRLDGSLLAVPLKAGYEGTVFSQSRAAAGLSAPGGVQVYRGFVFARLSADGPLFEDYFGQALKALDNMADRSPEGELQVASNCIRSVIRCNWKMYLENVNDTVHPISTHESASSTARKVGNEFADTVPTAMEQLLPFGAGYDFYSKMGATTLPHGHSILGSEFSIHTDYSDIPGYREMLEQAHGPARAREILSYSPQNVVLYPTLAVKGSPQILRVLRPVSAGLTRLETWVFQPKGAPAALLERGLTYARLVFSPMSVVAHDDVHLFESQQKVMASAGNPWVNLQRQFDPEECGQETHDFEDGNNELVMRNQYRAWLAMLAEPAAEESLA